MIIFVTSIRHPRDATSYQKALSLFDIAARSICKQTIQDFKLVVVCNEVPTISFNDERIHYHKVDFDPPLELNDYLNEFNIPSDKISCHPKKYFPNRGDKGSKIFSGLLYARQFKPNYVYILDADDWVNTNLLAFLSAQNPHPLWYVNQANLVNYTSKTFLKRFGTFRHCGSTLIYQWDFLFSLANISKDLDQYSTQKELLNGSSVHFIHNICGNHTEQYKLALKIGVEPKEVPFPAICYVLNTGENEVQDINLQHGFPINEKMQEEFGLSNDFVNRAKPSLLSACWQFIATVKSKLAWHRAKFLLHNKHYKKAN